MDKRRKSIESVLAISMRHWPKHQPGVDLLRSESHEYGLIVFMVDAVLFPEDHWFLPVYRLAIQWGCQYVNFDRDADPIEELPTYSWD